MVSDFHSDILVVDDSEIILQILSFQLRGFGLKFVTAKNGKIALEILKNMKFKYLLTDWLMPCMGGEELISQCHALDLMNMRIIVMSSLDISEFSPSEKRVIETCAHGFLPKPFTSRELHNALNTMDNHTISLAASFKRMSERFSSMAR